MKTSKTENCIDFFHNYHYRFQETLLPYRNVLLVGMLKELRNDPQERINTYDNTVVVQGGSNHTRGHQGAQEQHSNELLPGGVVP